MEINSDAASAKGLAARLGVATGWKLLGPFQSVSGEGFNHPFIDESDLKSVVDSDLEVQGIDNLPVKWVKTIHEEPDGTIEIARRLGGGSGCAYYASATITVPQDADYWIVVDRVGALRLWIDGEVILSDAADIAGDELHWVRKRLTAGKHQAVVKIADDLRPARFRICLERATSDASAQTAARRVLAALPGFSDPGNDPVLARLALQAIQSGDIQDRYWLAFLLAEKGYAQAAVAQVAEARTHAGDSNLALGRVIESRSYASLGRKDDARNALAGSGRESAAFAPTIDLLIAEALANGRTAEAERLLSESEKSLGKRYRADIFGVLIAAERGKDLYSRLEELRRTYPDVPELYSLIMSGRIRGLDVTRIFSGMATRKLPTNVRFDYASNLFEWGNFSAAHSQALRILGVLPSTDVLQALSLRCGYYGRNRTYAQSMDDLDTLLDEFPRSEPLLNFGAGTAGRYVSLLEGQAGSKPTAQQAAELSRERKRLQRCLAGLLALDPGDFASRERLRELKGEEPIGNLIRVMDPFSAIDSYEGSAPRQGTDAVCVLDEAISMFFKDGGRRLYRQLVLKITSRDGARRESSQELDADIAHERFNVDRAIVLKPDGTRTSAKTSGSRLSFPGLDQGDYLILSYSIDGSQRGSLRGEFWASKVLNSFYPQFRSICRFIYPETTTSKIAYHNMEGIEYRETRGNPFAGYKEVRIEVEEAGSVGLAPAMPNWRDLFAWVDVSSVFDWSTIVQWYRGLSVGRSIPTQGVNDVVRRLTGGASGTGEVISRLYDYVSNKINYEDLSFQYSAYVPQKPESVISDGFGDCKDKCALLVAMLRSAGIDAWMALSDPSYHGTGTFLQSTRFSHTIVVVPKAGPGGSDLLLDPTSGYFTYPELPPSLTGTWYLPIPPVSELAAELRRIEAGGQQIATEIFAEVEVGVTGTNVRASAVMHGVHAAEVRAILQSDDAEIRRTEFSLLVAQGIPGFKLAGYTASNLDSVLTSPVVDFHGEAPVAFGGGMSLSLPWFVALPPYLLDIVRAAARTMPLVVSESQLQTPRRQTCLVSLPKGYHVAPLPEDADFQFGTARISFHFSMKADRLVCEREAYLPRMSIGPADLAAFDSFLAAAVAKQAEAIRLVAEVR